MFEQMGEWVGVVAAVASALAAFASVWVARNVGSRSESQAAAERGRAAAQAEAEQRHAAFDTVAEWRRDFREWASEAIDVLSQASYSCSEPDMAGGLLECRFRLSALIDKGRFFLPNSHRDGHGTDKPFAFRGWRHAALDPLVAAERVLSRPTSGAFVDQKHALIAMRREFVSAAQQIFDPDGYNLELTRMIERADQAVTADRSTGRLLPHGQDPPHGADALLNSPPSRHYGIRAELRNRSEFA
jgi:hypothetical protein